MKQPFVIEMKAISKIKLVIVGMIIIGLAVLCPIVSAASEVDSVDIINYGLYKTTFALLGASNQQQIVLQ